MPQDWGWARRAAPGLAGSPLEAPWLGGGAAGSDESRLMSAWTRGLGIGHGGGGLETRPLGATPQHCSEEAESGQHQQTPTSAPPGRLGRGLGGGLGRGVSRALARVMARAVALDAVKVAVGDGEEQSSRPFQGDSVRR